MFFLVPPVLLATGCEEGDPPVVENANAAAIQWLAKQEEDLTAYGDDVAAGRLRDLAERIERNGFNVLVGRFEIVIAREASWGPDYAPRLGVHIASTDLLPHRILFEEGSTLIFTWHPKGDHGGTESNGKLNITRWLLPLEVGATSQHESTLDQETLDRLEAAIERGTLTVRAGTDRVLSDESVPVAGILE